MEASGWLGQAWGSLSPGRALERGKCWPLNLYDCKNAVRWLRVNADRYQVDADHIGVIGGSPGGRQPSASTATSMTGTRYVWRKCVNLYASYNRLRLIFRMVN